MALLPWPPGKDSLSWIIKLPDHWPAWLIQAFVFVSRPFGVSLDFADRHPWESIGRYLNLVQFQEFYFGAVYSTLERPSRPGKAILPIRNRGTLWDGKFWL
jgi:hypothetical protein